MANCDVLDAYSATGDVMLSASGDIEGGQLLNPTSLASTPEGLGTIAGASVYANKIFLNAGFDPLNPGTNHLAGIGLLGTFYVISSFSGGADSGFVTALAGDANIYLAEATTSLATTSNGDLGLVSISAGADATAFITDAVGRILNARPDENAIVIAGSADLVASGDIGSGLTRSNGYSGRIVSTVGDGTNGALQVSSSGGNLWLWNKGGARVAKVAANAAAPAGTAASFGLYAPDGAINIETSSPLTIATSSSSGNAFIEQAGNSADTGASAENSVLTLDPGITLTSTASYIEMDALDSIVLGANSALTAATTVTLNAAYLANPNGRADASVLINQGVTIRSGTSGQAGGNILIEAADNVTIDAATLTAAGSLTIKAGETPTVSVAASDDTTDNVDVAAGASLQAGTFIAISAADGIDIGAATLTAQGGDITLNAGDIAGYSASTTNPTVNDITIETGASLTASGSITVTAADNLHIEAATLRAQNGGIILNAGDLAGYSAMPTSASLDDLTIDSGATLEAETAITIGAGNDFSLGAATLTADTGAITLDVGDFANSGTATDGTTDSLTLLAGSQLKSTLSSITVRVGNDLTLDGAAVTGATMVNGLPTGGTVTTAGAALLAATTITLDAGYSASGSTANPATGPAIDSVVIQSGALIQAGTASPQANTSISVNAGNDITVAGVSGVAAAAQLIAGLITLQGGYLSAPGSFDGNDVVADLFGAFTALSMQITTGRGDDDVEFSPSAMAVKNATNIDTGAGNDKIHVFNLPSMATLAQIDAGENNLGVGQITDVINLDGQDGADSYIVDGTDNSNYVINVNDSGNLASGTNALTINGASTASGQTFLVRAGFVAILASDGNPTYQRINYNDTITNRLTINGGNVADPVDYGDSFYLDGNSAVTTINAGNGMDFFQVGQIYADTGFDTTQAGAVGGGLNPGLVAAANVNTPTNSLTDGLTVTKTTVGELSDGVDKATVIYGGAGVDTFEVYSNKADISLIGGSGDDTFVVRAFLVAAGTHIAVSGGSGNDTIEYNINAPVDIEGGTGFNTLVLLGTEANDTFVVTKDGVFGGGLDVSYKNIQAVTIDTLEGNDTVYVLSTPQDVVTTINGGDGGDTIVVGGDVSGAVISANTQGASSVTDTTVTSADANYNGIFVDGLSVAVGGSNQIISQQSQSVVHVGDATSMTSMTVSTPQALADAAKSNPGTTVTAYVNVSPAQPSAEWGAQGAAALQVSTDPNNPQSWLSNLTLAFTATYNATTGVTTVTPTQTVYMRAAPVPANDTYSRDETIVVASTLISTDVPSLNNITLPVVKVTLETSATGLIIDQGTAPTTIVAGQTQYSYDLTLNKQPAANETVTVALTGQNGGALPAGTVLSGSSVQQINGSYYVTFNASNWNQVQTVIVSSTLSQNVSHDAVPVDIEHWVSSTDSVAGQTKVFGPATDVNSNGAAFNAASAKPYYTVAGISADGSTLTLASGQTLTAENDTTVNFAPVAISGGLATASTPVASQVSFGDTNGAGTITLAKGQTWGALGYVVGQGIFIGTKPAGDVNLSVAATDQAGVLLLTPQGEAAVTSTQSYTYQMVMTAASSAPVTVNLLGDGQTIASSNDPRFNAANQTVTFDATAASPDWFKPISITLSVNPNYHATGTSQASNPATDMSFPAQPHTLTAIGGPLFIDGGTEAGQPQLVSAVGLPYETQNTPVSNVALQGEGVGSGAADVLKIYDDGNTTGTTGAALDHPRGRPVRHAGDDGRLPERTRRQHQRPRYAVEQPHDLVHQLDRRHDELRRRHQLREPRRRAGPARHRQRHVHGEHERADAECRRRRADHDGGRGRRRIQHDQRGREQRSARALRQRFRERLRIRLAPRRQRRQRFDRQRLHDRQLRHRGHDQRVGRDRHRGHRRRSRQRHAHRRFRHQLDRGR